jgi:hypothetical protein
MEIHGSGYNLAGIFAGKQTSAKAELWQLWHLCMKMLLLCFYSAMVLQSWRGPRSDSAHCCAVHSPLTTVVADRGAWEQEGWSRPVTEGHKSKWRLAGGLISQWFVFQIVHRPTLLYITCCSLFLKRCKANWKKHSAKYGLQTNWRKYWIYVQNTIEEDPQKLKEEPQYNKKEKLKLSSVAAEARLISSASACRIPLGQD